MNCPKEKILLICLSSVLSFSTFAGESDHAAEEKITPLTNFHISSKQLGIDSPFVIGASYSKELGTIIDGRYNHLFNENTAFSVGIEAGTKNYRLSTTLGHAFSEVDRAKITAETLRQKQTYTFRSGETGEWINQRGLGVEYEHLNSGKIISDFHVSANYVKSDNKSLSDQSWLSESETEFEVFNNERRIAGATRKGLVAGLGINPRSSSHLKLDLNYDEIKYNTSLSGISQNISGAGASLAWAEQITDKTSFNIKASARKPYNQYQAQVSHQLKKQIFGQPSFLQFGLSHQEGKNGLANDSRATLRLAFGKGKTSHISTKNTASQKRTALAQNNLLAWTSQPAIYESRVLTQTDQKAKDERLVVVTKSDLSAVNASIDKKGDITLNKVTGVKINQVTENGTAISITSTQFRLENGVLIIGVAKLEAPASYFVSVEQANGQFTHISFATFTGSVGLSFLEVTPNQNTPDQIVESSDDAEASTGSGNTIITCIDLNPEGGGEGAPSEDNAFIIHSEDGASCSFNSLPRSLATNNGINIIPNGSNIDITATTGSSIKFGNLVNVLLGHQTIELVDGDTGSVYAIEFDAVVDSNTPPNVEISNVIMSKVGTLEGGGG